MFAVKANMVCKFAILLTACASTNLLGQSKVDIIQIWQNFIASRVAAEECGAIDKNTDTHFLANLLDVTIRATQAIQERNSGVSHDEMVGRMKSAGDEIRGKVDSEIKQNGCPSPRIQQLLSMYKMHSTMRL
jgi:hypothetical protein